MSVIDKVQNLFSSDEEGASTTKYECADCGNTFESAKPEKKAKCMECLSSDTRVID